MSLADLTSAAAIRSAIEEYDRLGQDAFLSKYGFGRARRYVLAVDGKHYDSKAVVGAAHGFQYPDRGPLGPHDFSGGERTVKAKLEELGFTVVVLPTPSGPQRDTTRPGYVNRNGQEVVRDTGLPGNDHMQRIYVLHCHECGGEYGANGSDIFQRKCPTCQHGEPGLQY